jgi:hypothetical protein
MLDEKYPATSFGDHGLENLAELFGLANVEARGRLVQKEKIEGTRERPG